MTMNWQEKEQGDWGDEVDWKPEGEDELIGKLVSKATIDTKHGPCVLLKVEDKEGTVHKLWGSRAGLKSIIEEWDDELTVGREVGFRTKEKVKLKNGNDFMPYEVGFGDAVAAAAVPSSEEPF